MGTILQLQAPIIAGNIFPCCFTGKGKTAKDLGTRKTFSDAAKTAADFFDIHNSLQGESFYNIDNNYL